VHDAVEAEVQVWLVELEEFFEQSFNLFVFLAHCGNRPLLVIIAFHQSIQQPIGL
jgi:hypothetical protein